MQMRDVKWTRQRGAGSVMICMTKEKAIGELTIAGCADVTESVKDQLIEHFATIGIDPDDIDMFDWDATDGKTYWHVIDPK